jgi:hypothetical protein
VDLAPVVNIIKEHQGQHADELAPAAAALAENHGPNHDLPLQIRTFFNRFPLRSPIVKC